MRPRVSPTAQMRAEIDELFAADREVGAVLEDVARAGARLLLQAALEAEVTEFLGRGRSAPCGSPQRLCPGHGQDHGGAGDLGAPQAAGQS